jgi:hypothetical protein
MPRGVYAFWRDFYSQEERLRIHMAVMNEDIALDTRRRPYIKARRSVLHTSQETQDKMTIDIERVKRDPDFREWPGMGHLRPLAVAREQPRGHPLFRPYRMGPESLAKADVSLHVTQCRVSSELSLTRASFPFSDSAS